MTQRPWALVTGASYGVGRAIAVHLARNGYDLLITARTAEALAQTAERLSTIATVIPVPADLTGETGPTAITRELMERCPAGLDLFVHCAFGHIGEEEQTPLESLSEKEIREFIDVSLNGTYLATKAALPHLRARNGRAIFMVADWGLPMQNMLTSGTLSEPSVGSEVYISAKYAVNGFITSLERLSHVRVTGIYPGVIASARDSQYPIDPPHDHYLDLDSTPAEVESAGYHTPNEAIPLMDIATAVLFAARSEATVRAIVMKPSDFDYTGV